MESQLAVDKLLCFFFSSRCYFFPQRCHFIQPTKAKWYLIDIANIQWCYCEYKWVCWASCSHGNTSGMWFADWPWAAEVSLPHKFSSKVSVCACGCQGLLCFDSNVPDSVVDLGSFSQALYMWRSRDSFCNETASLSGKQRIVLILFTALFLLDNDGRHSVDACVMFQFTQEMHYSDTWIRVCWCGGGRPVGGTPVLSPSLVRLVLPLDCCSAFAHILSFFCSLTPSPHSLSLSLSFAF